MNENLTRLESEERAWDRYLDRLEQEAEMASERAKDFLENVIGHGSELEQQLRLKIRKLSQ